MEAAIDTNKEEATPPLQTDSRKDRGTRSGWGRSRIRGLFALAAKNPKWLTMFLLSRFELVRTLQRRFSKPCLRATAPDGPSVIDPVDVNEVSEQLESDGYFRGLRLPEQAVQRIGDFAQRARVFGNADPALPVSYSAMRSAKDETGQPIVIGDYLDGIKECDTIRELWSDPQLLEIAGRYLRAEPHLVRSRLWWSFPLDQERGGDDALDPAIFAQNRYHFDLHDWRTLKFFFYIRDVDDGCGPHLLLRGTHRGHKLSHQFSLRRGFDTESLVESYGSDRIVKMTGEAGFGFVEDPYGFHTGTPVKRDPRLVLEVAFGVSKVPSAGAHNAAI